METILDQEKTTKVQWQKSISLSDTNLKQFDFKLEFAQKALEIHNKYRKLHNVQDLSLNKDLIKHAFELCLHLRNNKVIPQFHKDFGISQYYYRSEDPDFVLTGDMPVEEWYKYKEFAEFGREPRNLKARWFYQIVWRNTKEMGIATVKKFYRHWAVAVYVPPGNIAGEYVANVIMLPIPSPIKIELTSSELLLRERKRLEMKQKRKALLDLQIKESEERRKKMQENNKKSQLEKIIQWCCCIKS